MRAFISGKSGARNCCHAVQISKASASLGRVSLENKLQLNLPNGQYAFVQVVDINGAHMYIDCIMFYLGKALTVDQTSIASTKN
jgi:hypothetical protein